MKKLFQGLLVGAIAAAIAVGLAQTNWMLGWESITWRWRVQAFAQPSPATDKIKVILLDQASLDWGAQTMGLAWPWPREVYGPILNYCQRGGAKAVAFDVLYTEPSVYGVTDDEAFGAAIQAGPPTAMATFFGRQARQTKMWPNEMPKPNFHVVGLKEWLTRDSGMALAEPAAAFPIPEVATNVSFLANVKDVPDDGEFKRATLFRIFDGQTVPSLGLAAYLAGAADVNALKTSITKGWLTVGDRKLPIDDRGKMILRFRGPSGTHQTFNAAEIIQSELRLLEGAEPPINDPHVFKDCYVFFGFSAPGLKDLKPVPVAADYPGVEVHATVLDNILAQDPIRDAARWAYLAVTILLALLSAIAVVRGDKARHTIGTFIVFLPIPFALGFLAYKVGWWWPIVIPEVGVILGLVGGVIMNYATVGREKAFIKRAFGHYVSKEVRDQMLDDPKRLQLGGERRELTIMFSDLQGFSSISERMEPQELTQLLNDYLSDMTEIILDEDGTLDKYEGDAIIAFWNAPIDQEDHALRACRAALRCQRKLAERREKFKERTGHELHMRIGMNTGEVVVGNMGSHERFDYTVLGDAANLAARLEGANKQFGTYTMISEATWEKTGTEFLGRELGKIRVVGRLQPVRVFEIIGFSDEMAPPHIDAFQQALAMCYSMNWSAAAAAFEKMKDDPVAYKYAEKCGQMKYDGVMREWDCVWNLTEK